MTIRSILTLLLLICSNLVIAQESNKNIESAIYEVSRMGKTVTAYRLKSDYLNNSYLNRNALKNELNQKEGFITFKIKDNYLTIYVKTFVEPEAVYNIASNYIPELTMDSHRNVELDELKKLLEE